MWKDNKIKKKIGCLKGCEIGKGKQTLSMKIKRYVDMKNDNDHRRRTQTKEHNDVVALKDSEVLSQMFLWKLEP